MEWPLTWQLGPLFCLSVSLTRSKYVSLYSWNLEAIFIETKVKWFVWGLFDCFTSGINDVIKDKKSFLVCTAAKARLQTALCTSLHCKLQISFILKKSQTSGQKSWRNTDGKEQYVVFSSGLLYDWGPFLICHGSNQNFKIWLHYRIWSNLIVQKS